MHFGTLERRKEGRKDLLGKWTEFAEKQQIQFGSTGIGSERQTDLWVEVVTVAAGLRSRRRRPVSKSRVRDHDLHHLLL